MGRGRQVVMRIAGCIAATLFCACAGTTVIAPSVEIRKDGTVKIDFEAKFTNTTTTSTAAHGKPGEKE